VAAISTEGVEAMMLVEGGCKTTDWCYFAHEA